MVRPLMARLAWAMLVVFPLTAAAQATRPEKPARPVPSIQHVVIISIDGLRPDVLLRADTPAIRALMAQGSFTMWANTTDVAITLPSHTSMVTGVSPKIHGITWNNASKPGVYPKVPTLFEYAHRAGYSTGLVAGKKKFETLAKPGTVDVLEIPADAGKGANKKVEEAAVKVILERHPDVLMVHFPETDSVGHAIGWGTPEQLAAVATADHGVGAIVAALRKAGAYDSTLIILSADHGGAGRGHGGLDPRSRHIPWIAEGPDLRAD
jgi:predicted AlkP superfamily pyrophosphatase or phosphodiesterase